MLVGGGLPTDPQETFVNPLTGVLHRRTVLYMNTNEITEIRFTAKRACYWNGRCGRWITISRDKATALIATGQAVELTEGMWI